MAKKQSRLLLIVAVVVIVGILLALVIFLGTQSAQGLTPGVKAGDEFIYNISGSYVSTDSSAVVPETFYQANMTEWYKVTVTDVNGTKVSINTKWRFENGTELDITGYVKIESGEVFPSNGFWPIYASNLKVDDIVRPSRGQLTVNDTNTKEYASGITRETNSVSWTEELYDRDDPTGSTTLNKVTIIQFDRETGMLVQLTDISIYNNPQLTLTTTWKLIESNVWTVS